MKTFGILSLSATVVFVAFFLFVSKYALFSGLPAALYVGCALLIMAPLSGEEGNWFHFKGPVFLAVSSVAAAFVPAWLRLFVTLSLGIDLFVRLRLKMRRVRKLFRSDEVWHTTLHLTNGLYALWLAGISSPEVHSWWMAAVVCLVQAGIAWLSLRLRLKDRTLLLGEKQVRIMRTIARTNLRDPLEYDGSIENRKMMSLYKRAVEFMLEKRPFLDESFDLEHFAKTLFTNKVYLSRTINALSGRNFRQFVNYYRVQYSTELARQDPRLRVEELAMMSGFHTVVSYNMAFRLFMSETPSEWLHRYRASLRS